MENEGQDHTTYRYHCSSTVAWFKLLPNKFADNKLNIAQMMISFFARVENTVGKGENAGYQHFLFFPTMFFKAFNFQGC